MLSSFEVGRPQPRRLRFESDADAVFEAADDTGRPELERNIFGGLNSREVGEAGRNDSGTT